jgi:hypothetical protein
VEAFNTETFQLFLKENDLDRDVLVFMAGPACFSCHEVWPDFEFLVKKLH